jgi:NitT/TauT family transport system ATP-binding protein
MKDHGVSVGVANDSHMSDRETILEVEHLGMTYGTGPQAVTALTELSFSVNRGEFVCIVGPSGCGKTTLLRCLSGLLRPTRGSATMAGQRIVVPPPGLALVFQEYGRSLFPWLTVSKNVAAPLAAQGIRRRVRDEQAEAALAQVGLEGFGDRYPWQLSGGMQQRVAIARAIAFRPTVLLMDEPFASVDAQSRADLEDLVLRVQRATRVTVVFVTHDIDESVYLGDRVIVLTNRPTTIRAAIPVTFDGPRDQLNTRASAAFVNARSDVWKLIRSERHEV